MPQLNVPELLAALRLEEKAALVTGADFWHTAAVERLGIPSVMVADGPHGLRKQPEHADHVGIGGSNPATCFPPAVALASSWDRALLYEVGEALGVEARAEALAVVLGPGINIKRSPLCGRNFEYFSEDPLVSGELAASFIQGVQSQGVGTSLKHFAVNNQETDRLRISAQVDERTINEIYLAGFERAVTKSKPWTVMCSYNKINGEWASQNHWLLTEVLRDAWGFDGVVVSDWGAVADPVAAVAAGLDLEMPGNPARSPALVAAAVRDGRLAEADLDRAVARVLTLVNRAIPGLEEPSAATDYAAHHALARRAAAGSIVLLKNDSSLLPLAAGSNETIAVIGEFARTPRYQGAGSSQVNPVELTPALSALEEVAAGRLTFAAGYEPEVDEASDDSLLVEAVALAAASDVVLLFVGLPSRYESEGFDREHLDLPPNQLALVDAVAAAADQVVVILSNGSAVTMAPWHERVAAVVEGWLLGQNGGGAMADVLFGEVSPSGKLTETLPVRLADNPSHGNFPGELGEVRYGEGVLVGYRAYDAHDQEVAYPFGHGLSYSSFAYRDLEVDVLEPRATADSEAVVTVAITVTNVGEVDASEVVQLYVGDPEASVQRPVRELRGFTKEALKVGDSSRVLFTVSGRDLAYWHRLEHRWFLEPGDFVVEVGASSRDIRAAQVITITGGDTPTRRLSADSSYEEWLADPIGGPLMSEHLERRSKSLADADVIGNFPLSRLAALGDLFLSHAELDELVSDFEKT